MSRPILTVHLMASFSPWSLLTSQSNPRAALWGTREQVMYQACRVNFVQMFFYSRKITLQSSVVKHFGATLDSFIRHVMNLSGSFLIKLISVERESIFFVTVSLQVVMDGPALSSSSVAVCRDILQHSACLQNGYHWVSMGRSHQSSSGF